MVRRHPTMHKTPKPWRREDGVNEWGTHDPDHFHPYRTDIPLRCFQCSNLMAADFTSEGECPNCHWLFHKSDARDMYVEGMIAYMHGGWDKEKLDLFSCYDYPVRMLPDGGIERIEDVERTMASWATKANRKADVLNSAEEWGPKRKAWEEKMSRLYAEEMTKKEVKRRSEAEREMIEFLRNQDNLSELR